MSSGINIPAILIANGMGLAILFIVAIGSIWRSNVNAKVNRELMCVFFATALSCIVDPICFMADGKPGLINRFLVYGGNTLLYFGGISIGVAWVFLVVDYVRLKISKAHRTILWLSYGITLSLLALNLFVPTAFGVDENNVYFRMWGYWVYNVFYLAMMLDGLILYIIERRKSGGLKFFPVWAFLVPAAVGIIIQTMFYGISTGAAFVAISVVGLIICLQNELMLVDKLTGLYNRFYLNTVEQKLKGSKKLVCTAMMLDINGFKSINDRYGHKMGDDALINMGNILSEAVGAVGEAVRYAGDEFIVILNIQDEAQVKEIIARIHELLDKFNAEKTAPYELSISVGSSKLDLNAITMDEFMDRIDKLMYENKKDYYEQNTHVDRRKA